LYIEIKTEVAMTEMEEKPKVSKEAMTAIIVTGVVAVICILACTGVMIALIINVPW
jgi:hypothetical protein